MDAAIPCMLECSGARRSQVRRVARVSGTLQPRMGCPRSLAVGDRGLRQIPFSCICTVNKIEINNIGSTL
jgi:hypothetical protein